MGIAVADAPTLEHDDGNQNKHYHDDSGGEGDGENHFVIHNAKMYHWLFRLQNYEPPAKQMSHWRKKMSQIRKNYFSPISSGKKT
jgi:hypothetical protein